MEFRAAGYFYHKHVPIDPSLASFGPTGRDVLAFTDCMSTHSKASIAVIWQLVESRQVQGQIRRLIRKGAPPCSPGVLRDRTPFVSRQSSGCCLIAALHAARADVEAKIQPTHRLCP